MGDADLGMNAIYDGLGHYSLDGGNTWLYVDTNEYVPGYGPATPTTTGGGNWWDTPTTTSSSGGSTSGGTRTTSSGSTGTRTTSTSGGSTTTRSSGSSAVPDSFNTDLNNDGLDDYTGLALGVRPVSTSVSWTGFVYSDGQPVWPNGAPAGPNPNTQAGGSDEPFVVGSASTGYFQYDPVTKKWIPITGAGGSSGGGGSSGSSGGGSSSTRSGGFNNSTTNTTVHSGGFNNTSTSISEYGPERVAIEQANIQLQIDLQNSKNDLERELALLKHDEELRRLGLDEQRIGIERERLGLDRAKTIADLMQTTIPADVINRLALGGGNIENAIAAGAAPSDAENLPLALALGTTGTGTGGTGGTGGSGGEGGGTGGGGTDTGGGGGGTTEPPPTTPPATTPPNLFDRFRNLRIGMPEGGLNLTNVPQGPVEVVGPSFEQLGGVRTATTATPDTIQKAGIGFNGAGTYNTSYPVSGHPAGSIYVDGYGWIAPTDPRYTSAQAYRDAQPGYVSATPSTTPTQTTTVPGVAGGGGTGDSSTLTAQEAFDAANPPTPTVGGEYQSPQGGLTQDDVNAIYGPGTVTWNGTQWVRRALGTVLPPQANQMAQRRAMGQQGMAMGQPRALGRIGMVRDPMMVTGDAPMSRAPMAGGARPEIIVNPTRAPLGVIPSRMAAPMLRQAQGTVRRYALGTTNYFNQSPGGPGLGVIPSPASAYGATDAMRPALDRAAAMRAGVQVPNASAYDVAWDTLSPTLRSAFLQAREAKYGIPIADQLNEIARQRLQGFRTPAVIGY